MKNRFYSGGKLLLTGEYLVLNGAKVLAVPLKTGQYMETEDTGTGGEIHWVSFYQGNCWFDATFSTDDFSVKSHKGLTGPDYIKNLLNSTRRLNPSFLTRGNSFRIVNTLEFSPEWGLGSSSSLISNLAGWADVDPFELNGLISNGSGYDIACAGSQNPILYQLKNGIRSIEHVDFKPIFSEHLYLIWMGRKKNTSQDIDWYLQNIKPAQADIDQINEITESVLRCDNLSQFRDLINEHNLLMENILNRVSVRNRYFPDFKGIIKSLGAWGGDFILAVSDEGYKNVYAYFNQKGFEVVFRWDELVKNLHIGN